MNNRRNKRNVLIITSFLWLIVIAINAQEIIPLYKGVAPGSEDWDYKEIESKSDMFGDRIIRNVCKPTLTVFKPDKEIATGTAVIVCPGGGNFMLCFKNEGTEVAEWLSQKGITAFVLKYRLNKTPEDPQEFNKYVMDFFMKLTIPSNSGNAEDTKASNLYPGSVYYGGEDGLKSVEYVRNHASELGINPGKIGMIGFSAGAMVTLHTVLHSEPRNQPNFAALIYGGWLFGTEVPGNAPPLFIAGAADDIISAENPALYNAWIKAGNKAELHMYSRGGHGFANNKKGSPVDTWIDRYYEWLKDMGF